MKSGFVIFLTGMPCSGKSTIAEALYNELLDGDQPIVHFDGDSFRKKYCSDLGFTKEDRVEI